MPLPAPARPPPSTLPVFSDNTQGGHASAMDNPTRGRTGTGGQGGRRGEMFKERFQWIAVADMAE